MNAVVLAFQIGLLVAAFVTRMIAPSKSDCHGAYLGPKVRYQQMVKMRALCAAVAMGFLTVAVLATMAHFF